MFLTNVLKRCKLMRCSVLRQAPLKLGKSNERRYSDLFLNVRGIFNNFDPGYQVYLPLVISRKATQDAKQAMFTM